MGYVPGVWRMYWVYGTMIYILVTCMYIWLYATDLYHLAGRFCQGYQGVMVCWLCFTWYATGGMLLAISHPILPSINVRYLTIYIDD